MREVLVAIVNSGKSDKGLKTVVVRLILRLGYIHSTAEELMLAAEMQSTHKLDLTWDLMPLLEKTEKYRKYTPPAKVDSSSGDPFSKYEEDCVQSHVYFRSPSDSDRSYDPDNGVACQNWYFMWSKERGIFKGERKADTNYWEDSNGNYECRREYNQVTFVRIDGKVHIRSSHLPDQPFVELDYESCAVKENYQPWTSQDNLLNW